MQIDAVTSVFLLFVKHQASWTVKHNIYVYFLLKLPLRVYYVLGNVVSYSNLYAAIVSY